MYAFDGTAKQVVSLNATNSSFGCWGVNVTIFKPDGTQLGAVSVCNGNSSGQVIPDSTLPVTGTYMVYVDPGSNTGSVTLELYNAAEVTGTISIGGPPVTVSNSVPGQDMGLTFSGSAGQLVSLSTTNSTFGCWAINLIIYNPDGTTLNNLSVCPGNTTGTGTLVLPQTGTYTLFFDPSGGATGSIAAQLWNLSDLSSTVSTSDTYATTILGDAPRLYWRLDESGPPTAANAVPTFSYNVAGPTSPDTAIKLDGNTSYIATSRQFSNPSIYSVELWFKTSTSSGGKLIGFSGSQTGSSSSYDRHIYMTNSGQLIFGQDTGSVLAVVTSSGSYNNGAWHYAVGTYDGSTMVLYVDGSPVGSLSAAAPVGYSGYWRIGYDNLYYWPSIPSSYYFQGSIGEAAVYSRALSASQVSSHYAAAGGGNYDSTILGDSPTSYWKLKEAAGPTFADATGGGNTGTAIHLSNNGSYQGTVTYAQPGAISTDKAVAFDGISGLVQSVWPPIGNTTASMEAWVYIPSSWVPASGSYSAVIQSGNGGMGFGIGNNFQGTTGYHLFGLYENVRWIQLSNDPQLSANAWYHLVMTVDGSGVPTFYINGSSYSQASSGSASNVPTGSMSVGDDPPGGGRFFGGTVDEVAAYNYALSATQVSNHYHASGR